MDKVQYKGYNSQTGPSPAIWADCPVLEMIADPAVGFYFFDDFVTFPVIPTITSEAGVGNHYKAYNTGDGTITLPTSVNSTETPGGVIAMRTDTDGDQGALATVATPFRLSGTTSHGKLWFEARIATTQILTNDAQIFVGLGETDGLTLAAAVPLADGNACANGGAMIGFGRDEDGLGVLQTRYADRATSWTAVDATAGTIAALTWTKVGMVWDPNVKNQYGDNLSFYQDGTLLDTGLTNAEIAALTNLDANNLGLLMAIFADSSGTSSYLYMDWWRAGQLRIS